MEGLDFPEMSTDCSQIIKLNGEKRIRELREIQNSYVNKINDYYEKNSYLEVEKERLKDDYRSTLVHAHNLRIRKVLFILSLIELSILYYLFYSLSLDSLRFFPTFGLTLQAAIISFYFFTLLLLFRSKVCLFLSNLFFGLIIVTYYMYFFFPGESEWYYMLIPIVVFEALLIWIKPLRTLSSWGIAGMFAVSYLLEYTINELVIFIPVALILPGLLLSIKFRNLYHIPQKISAMILLFNYSTVSYAISYIRQIEFPYISDPVYVSMIHGIFDIQSAFLKSVFQDPVYMTLLAVVLVITIVKEVLYHKRIGEKQ